MYESIIFESKETKKTKKRMEILANARFCESCRVMFMPEVVVKKAYNVNLYVGVYQTTELVFDDSNYCSRCKPAADARKEVIALVNMMDPEEALRKLKKVTKRNKQ